MQSQSDLDNFYETNDPWGYFSNPDDKLRLDILIESLPRRRYSSSLDIGCGNGFITLNLPGDSVYGVDLSFNAISHARNYAEAAGRTIIYEQLDVFNVDAKFAGKKFDLIVITGVLYENYIGKAESIISIKLDKLLSNGGILALVHIKEWFKYAPQYSLIERQVYNYRSYEHLLEVYQK